MPNKETNITTPLQQKIKTLRAAVARMKGQQSINQAYLDCLSINLDAVADHVGEMERNLTVVVNPSKGRRYDDVA